ncbi:MAG: DUF2085 domain-containing protein [Anaerolineae bacterium]|nr:MAG: DUF2085 domain-containing protein [Anaerolineae bacterium]
MPRSHLQRIIPLAGSILLFLWWQTTPPGLLGKADAIGYAVCHRIDVRSFHLGARAIPLCARCTGMYAGAMLGLLYQRLVAPRHSALPPLRLWIPLGLLAAAFVVDGTNSYLHFFPGAPGLYQPNNILRLLTGTGVGVVISAFLYPAFQDTMWQHPVPVPALKDGRALAILLGLALGMDALILTENPLLLYPLALISAAGVLVLLSMVYGMLWVILWKAERFATRYRQLLPPMLVGVTLGLVQIALLDFLRFKLTGTWDGFHLG